MRLEVQSRLKFNLSAVDHLQWFVRRTMDPSRAQTNNAQSPNLPISQSPNLPIFQSPYNRVRGRATYARHMSDEHGVGTPMEPPDTANDQTNMKKDFQLWQYLHTALDRPRGTKERPRRQTSSSPPFSLSVCLSLSLSHYVSLSLSPSCSACIIRIASTDTTLLPRPCRWATLRHFVALRRQIHSNSYVRQPASQPASERSEL